MVCEGTLLLLEVPRLVVVCRLVAKLLVVLPGAAVRAGGVVIFCPEVIVPAPGCPSCPVSAFPVAVVAAGPGPEVSGGKQV